MNKKAKNVNMADAKRIERLHGELIMKCCDLVESSIRMASHLLEAAHLEFEALMTVMVMVCANFLSVATKMYGDDTGNKIIDTFIEGVREQTQEYIKEDRKDKNAN